MKNSGLCQTIAQFPDIGNHILVTFVGCFTEKGIHIQKMNTKFMRQNSQAQKVRNCRSHTKKKNSKIKFEH